MNPDAIRLTQIVARAMGSPSVTPQPFPGTTWCNRFVALVAKEFGVSIPPTLLANDIDAALKSDPPPAWAMRFVSVPSEQAQAAANEGRLVIAAATAPGKSSDKHGHVAIVVPVPDALPVWRSSKWKGAAAPQIATVGREIWTGVPASFAFGPSPPRYWVLSEGS